MNNILTSVVVAAITAALISWGVEVWHRNNEREEKLYGLLKYNLLTMRALTKNRETLTQEILNEGGPIEMKNQALREEPRLLIEKWHESKDEIAALFQKYPGLIKPKDLDLVGEFIDACIKRNIAKEGRSHRAGADNRMDKILEIIEKMQERFLRG
jgi:hypothetical protein